MGKKATAMLFQSGVIVITVLFAVLGILGWIGSLLSPQQFWIGSMMSVVMLPILIVNFLFLIYWGFKLKVWALFSLLAIGMNFNLLTATFQFRFKDKTEYPNTLKIATYNIRGFAQPDYNFTLKSIAEFLQEENVDIACFQEYHETEKYPIDSIARHFKDMPYFAAPMNKAGEINIVIFSKYPILRDSLIQFKETSNSSVWADIEIEGETVRVFSNHFQTTNINQSKREIAQLKSNGITDEKGEEAFSVVMTRLRQNANKRAEQANLIRSIIDTTKTGIIVCGDFNDTPESYTYRTMSHGLNDGFKTSGRGFAHTYKYMLNLFRLDYIFYSDRFEGVKYYSPSLEWSDHNPVLLQFTLRN